MDVHWDRSGPGLIVVQLLGHVQLFETPWTTAHQASLVVHHLLDDRVKKLDVKVTI